MLTYTDPLTMKHKQPPQLLLFIPVFILFFSLVQLLITSGCKKKDAPAPVPVPIPPPVIDTIQYIKRLEQDFVTSNPPVTRRSRAYTFYYDNNKRVTKVGIKNYDQVLFDTATCLLFYTGSNQKPDMIITPNARMSGFSTP